VIKNAGVPVAFDAETHGYRIRRDFFMPPVELTFDESLALVTLAKQVADQEQIPFTKPAARALAKVRSHLPAAVRRVVDELDPHVTVHFAKAGPHDGVKDVYEAVRDALTSHTALRCRYESLHKSEEDAAAYFLFKPYALFFSQRAWYAVGFHGARDALRTLKLNRFTAVESTDYAYEIPASFDLDDQLGLAWRMIRGTPRVDVTLRFDPSFAETIEDTSWHATQETQEQEDGSLVFRCTVDGLDEIVWWILSMGPHCRVLGPPELAERVRTLAGQTAALYADNGGGDGPATPPAPASRQKIAPKR
jgi:predicted DNA-binding transcriptional regulator YafY